MISASRFVRKSPGGGNRGTTLIFTLIILAVAAMVLAGTVFVSSAIVEHTVATQAAITRRQQLENSRVLAVQFMREQVFSETNPQTNGVNITSVSGGGYALGGLAIAGSGTTPWGTTNRPVGPNPFSPAGDTYSTVSGTAGYRSGYTINMAATLYWGTNEVAWNFEARTRNPTLGYDLANYATTGTAGNVTSSSAIAITNATYWSGTVLNNAQPGDLAQSGSQFAGAIVGTTINLTGAGTTTTSEYSRVDGALTLYINGNNATTSYIITGSLSSLTFNYSGTYTTVSGFPLRVVCSSLDVSPTINLNAGSIRPINLVYNSTRSVTINHTSTPRLTGLFLNAPLTIQSGTIQGGFRTVGGSVSVTGVGALNIIRETDPGTLDDVMIRRGWVESYRND
jgi:hypothetical protein